MTRTETNLFAPYKALGVICSSVPPAWAPPVSTRAHFHDGYVLCALDNVVVAYGLGRRLQLAFSTDVLDDGTITLLAADAHRHYVCFANKTLVAVIRNRTIERRLFVDGGHPKLLLSLTDSLVVVDSSNSIHLFDVHTGQPLVRLDSTASFDITAIVHPINYLNKILVGAADGRMRLWNLCSGRLVHEFPVSDDTFNAPITVLEQSPAVDVIGVGLADGRILLRNIKFDKLICSFRHGCAQITALAFRTDGVDAMVSANAEGLLAVWDLNERQLLVQLSTAHSAKIMWLHFVLGQPYLISAGEDNRIVKWFFRSEVALPEIDTALEGHSEPVTALRFCAEHLVVSAGRDGHVRRFNTGAGEKSGGSVHFGLAREVKKGDLSKDRFMDVLLNPIVQIELSHGREAVWDNMICRHEESPLVSTWSTRRGTRGSHLLCHERFSKNAKLLHAMVTSLCISCCGTFAILGHSTGHVDVWNMQSGRWKYELQRSEEGGSAKKNRKKRQQQQLPAHDGAVTGLALDLTNRHLVTGSDDGTIQFWHFRSPQQQRQPSAPALGSRLQVQDAVHLFRLDAHNSLLAVGLRGGEVGVLDILCRRIARRFFHSSCIDWPQNARLTGLDFSSDGKWLVSADNLGFLKVWDLVTGSLIDVMRCAAPCVGLAFSERNDFLATCHEGQRGVYLWANKAMFLASHSMSARPEHELHSAATAAITALPATAPVVGEDLQQEVEEEVEAVVQGHRAHDDSEDQRSQAEEEEVENRVAKVEEEEMKQDERETRAILIDEEEEEEDGVASLSTLSLEVGAELPERLQLDPSLYTLSGLAPARWAGLPHLEHIRRRNKPTEPPKKPKAAPFFLPTVGTINSFAFDKEVVDELKKGGNNNETADDGMEGTSSTMEQAQLEDGDGRAILKGKRRTTTDQQQQQLRSQWTRRLMSATTDDNLRAVFAELREMSVSALDLQLRCLSGTAELVQFVAMLAAQMECRRDFDLVQSLLAAFLNIHHGTLWSTSNNNGVQLQQHQQQLKNSNGEDVEMTSSDGGTRTAETTAAAVAEGVQDDANVLNNCRLTEQLDRLHKLQQQAHNTLAQLFDDNTAMTEFVKGAFA